MVRTGVALKGRRNWPLALFLALLLSGCWDRREIEEFSTSLATGVDLCAEGEDCNLISTRQIAIPGRIPLGGGEGGAAGPLVTTFVLSAPGQDGPDSGRKAQAQLNYKLAFGHTRIIVLSEDFARQGVQEYMDYLRRLPELRRLLWIAVSEGRAEAVIRARPALERVPALFLNDQIEDAVRTGRLPEVFWGEFLTRLSNKGEDTIAPLIRMEGPNKPALHGVAVFREDKMVGKLTPEEMVTYMQLRGLRRASELLTLDLPEGGRADIRIFGRRANQRIWWKRGVLHVHHKLEMESDLVSLSPELDSSDPQVLRLIERKASEMVTRRAQALVKKLQTEFQSDILGWGEQVRAQAPGAWKQVEDWRSVFSKAEFTCDTSVQLRRMGLANH